MMLPPSPFDPDTTKAILVGLAIASLLFVIVRTLLDGSDMSSYIGASRRRRKEREESSNKDNGDNLINNPNKEHTNVIKA